MSERRKNGQDRTDRTEMVSAGGRHLSLPSVADVLRLDVLVRAMPEILAGEENLHADVRWVHVAETMGVARLVSGGELLLATGVGWPTDEASLRHLGADLVRAGISGLILELGERMPCAPDALVSQFRAAGCPFAVLHREARFVEITEAVHSRIVDQHTVALQERARIHELFTGLSLRGSPADFIVSQAARVLGCPVILEDTGHRVILADHLDGTGRDLRNWEQRSRASRGGGERDGWTSAPVEARGTRWGRLIALPGPAHPAGRSTVVEQAAVALALSRLADRDDDEWTRRSHAALLGALLGRRFASEDGLSAQVEASGFPLAGRHLYGVALQRRTGTMSSSAITRVLDAARENDLDVLAAVHPTVPGLLMVALSVRPEQPVSEASLLSLSFASDAARAGVGDEARGLGALLLSLEEARLLAERGGDVRSISPSIHRARQRPLLRLVTSLGRDPRLLKHAERMLSPLIEYDLAHDGDLVAVLTSYLTYPGNRTRAAAASHLSRSVFYQRLALIRDLLERDLDDGETISALHTAVLARQTVG